MKLIALLHESMNFSLYIQDLNERVSSNSLEYKWVKKLISQVKKSDSFHKEIILDFLQNLVNSQTAFLLTIDEFYSTFPYLKNKYCFQDDLDLKNEYQIQSKVKIKVNDNNYLLKYVLDTEIYSGLKHIEHLDTRIHSTDLWLKNQLAGFSLSCHNLNTNNLMFSINNEKLLDNKHISFIENLEYLVELDLQLLHHFYEKNASSLNYLKQREIIPFLISSSINESLLHTPNKNTIDILEQIILNKMNIKKN